MFLDNLSFGQDGQDFLINVLEKHFGYKFIAGERFGAIENVEFIEEIENCTFIPPDRYSGAKLRFLFKNGSFDEVVMPDVFMERNGTDRFYWVEVKRHREDSDVISINKSSFDDYEKLSKYYTRNNFEVMCINPSFDGTIDIYRCNIEELINKKPSPTKLKKNIVYTWKILEVMKKLNRYPVNPERYR